MTDFFRDLKFGARQLMKAPGFTLAAVLCLAIGIGANSAAFSFVQGLLTQQVPIRDADRVVRMYLNYSQGLRYGSWSYPDLVDAREQLDGVFSGIIGNGVGVFSVSADGTNRRVFGSYVTGDYFDFLGIEPALGRGFLREEDSTEGTHPVLVLSHAAWQRDFGGDPGAVGRTMLVNGREMRIVGIAPEGFTGHDTAMAFDFWIPFSMQPALSPTGSMLERRGNHWIQSATARLRDGVTPEQARQAADALYARLAEQYPDSHQGITIDMYADSAAALHPAVRGGFVAMLSMLSAVVAFVLLLACANVAGLLLARGSARQREVGIRMALGAGRGRLLRQLLTENLSLSLLGGLAGLGMGALLIRLITSIEPPTNLPLAFDIRMDGTVLAFTFAVTILTGTLFGLAPALQTSRTDLTDTLRESSAGSGTATSVSRLRRLLVIGQVALCAVLLITAGRVLQSLEATQRLDLGFDPDHVVVGSVDPALQGYALEELPGFYDRLRDRLASRPGVEAVGITSALPLSMMSQQRGILPEGYEIPEGQNWPSLDYAVVDHGYFAAAGIPVLHGRGFREQDGPDSAPVAMVNESFVDRFWPGETGVGKRVQVAGVDAEVIGVVPTGKYFSLGEDPKPFYYLPLSRHLDGDMQHLVVRTAGAPEPHVDEFRRQVAAIDPTLPVSDLGTMDDALTMAFLPARLAAAVVGGFAVLALLLSCVGLYGVISFNVTRGIRDIGIRMALGADSGDVVRRIVLDGLRLTAIGLALGTVGGYLMGQAAEGLLVGVDATDPFAYATALPLLLGAAALASWLPARRATRIDPLLALRAD